MNMISAFFKKNWPHFLAIFVFYIIAKLYLSPVMDGMDVAQHDTIQHSGMAKEIVDYREKYGKETMWTGNMFGGMPSAQISLIHDGNVFSKITTSLFKALGSPVAIMFLYMLCFYIGANLFRINRWVSMALAICFAFCTYNMILITVGHNSKAVAIAYLVPVLGSLYYTFRVNWKIGGALFAIFFAFQLSANHLQITYYGGIALLILGLGEIINTVKGKIYKNFGISSVVLAIGAVLAIVVNYGNLKITSEYADYTKRGGNELTINPDGSAREANATGGLEKDYIFEYSSGIAESAMIFSPYVKGPGSSFDFDGAELTNYVDEYNEQASGEQQVSSEEVLGSLLYWGDQPIFSAPQYVGAVLVALALLALFFIKDSIKWSLLVVTILAVLLSWGNNFSGLSDFMLDNVPYYNKFRAPAMILILTEITIGILAGLFVSYIIENKEELKQKKNLLLITGGSLTVIVFILAFMGISSSNIRESERSVEGKVQYAMQVKQAVQQQLAGMTPEQLAQSQIDMNNPTAAIEGIVQQELEKRDRNLNSIKSIRENIAESSMIRSGIYILFAIGIILLIAFTSVDPKYVLPVVALIAIIDLFGVSKNYLNGDTEGAKYTEWWMDAGEKRYPMATNEADKFILDNEIKTHPSLKAKIEKAKTLAQAKIIDKELTGVAATNCEDAYIFGALNQNTNYRVFELTGGAFNDTRCAAFHKSIGGYHAAKLSVIQNLADFHLFNQNNKVFDMMNVKYILKQGEKGMQASINSTNLGPAWFVQGVQEVKDANEEIIALGNRLLLTNIGKGSFLVNGKAVASAEVTGREKLQYLNVGRKDTLDVLMTSQLKKGEEIAFVEDNTGKTNLIMASALKMMTPANTMNGMVSLKIAKEFRPDSLAVMTSEVASKLKVKTWKAGGTIKNILYAPNRLVYMTDNTNDGFAVFSEIQYPKWKATIDGKEVPISKVNYLLRGLEVPKGKHKIVFEFGNEELDSLNTRAMLVSVLMFGLLGFAVYLGIKKGRNANLT